MKRNDEVNQTQFIPNCNNVFDVVSYVVLELQQIAF